MKPDPSVYATNATSPYFQYPYSLDRLPPIWDKGLYAPAICGLLSAISCLFYMILISKRLLRSRKTLQNYFTYNQYLVLLNNLLCAEIIQGTAWTLSFHWLKLQAIPAPSTTCTAQGMLINLGDVASGLFILSIAAHTFYASVSGHRIGIKPFVASVCGVWLLAWFITLIGPLYFGRRFMVPVAGYCWINPNYMTERLALRFFWIFLVQFGSLCVYAAVLINIRATMKEVKDASTLQASGTHKKLDRVAKFMVIYPMSYIILTLPVSGVRMWNLAHPEKPLPNKALLASVTMLASCGWIDAVLYTYSRRHISETRSSSDTPSATQGTRSIRLRLSELVTSTLRAPPNDQSVVDHGKLAPASISARSSGIFLKQTVEVHVEDAGSSRNFSGGGFEAIEEGHEVKENGGHGDIEECSPSRADYERQETI
ncbi:Hypothetical protein D9617_7g030710 [Elsinoe fawcettii]|nr:Hypothetical protein D9617_7g030710 [Elsinoe fawcettii]